MAAPHLSYPIFRPDSILSDNCYHGKRQIFLRSYQFNRKRRIGERIKLSVVRLKRLVWTKLRAVRKFRRLVWFRLRYGYFRRRSFRLLNRHGSTDSTFW